MLLKREMIFWHNDVQVYMWLITFNRTYHNSLIIHINTINHGFENDFQVYM